jgi:cytochrome c oxidase cbb3-type subunit IV
MDINTLRSVMTVVSFVVFLGIVAWAVSAKNKSRFEQAAQLPLLED